MTLRLGGNRRTSTRAIASLTLATALACGAAMTGCGDDNNNPPVADAGPDVTTEAGMDAAKEAAPPTACATPTFMPAMGTVALGTTVTITSAGLPATGLIYFTTDGTQPTHSSLAVAPGGTIVVSQTEMVKAIATASTCSDSMTATASYTVPPPMVDAGPEVTPLMPCPLPTFMPATGTMLAQGQNVVIAAAGLPAAPAGYIFFTTDGSLAGRTSPVYNSGTVGIQVPPAGETIHAISSTLGATCLDSVQSMATYTVIPAVNDGGAAPAVPTFAPTGAAATQANDFTVTLTDTTPSAIICYTVGAMGAVAAPKCTTTATTAVCSGGTLTYSAPVTVNGALTNAGQVEVDAVACVPGAAQSAVGKNLYTLQAATPTMTPAAGTYAPGQTATFVSTTSGANIFYTINGAAPSCTTPVAGQLTYAGAFPLQGGSYQAVACKTGYVPSAASTAAAFTVNLAAPTVTPAAGTYSTVVTATVSNSASNPASSWVCSTVGATATLPVCGTATGTCTTGSATAPTITNGSTIEAIACGAAGITASAPTTVGPYVLVAGTPVISVAGMAASGSVTVGATVYAIASDQVTAAAPAGDATGYFCFAKNVQFSASAVCGTAGTPGTCLQGAPSSGDLTIGNAYAAGDFVTVVACPGGQSAGYTPSPAVTLSFLATGASASPIITPGALANTSTVTPVVANANLTGATLCYTTDSSTPACTAGSTAANCKTVTGVSSQTMAITVTTAGAGYLNPPVPVLTGGAGSCTGAPVATLGAGGAIAGVTVTGCSGYTSAPAVTFNPGAGAGATATVTETITVAVTNGGTGYGGAAPTASLTETDGVTDFCTVAGVTCTVTIGTGASAGKIVGVTVTEGGAVVPIGTAPTLSFTGGSGTGGAGTVTLAQTVAFSALAAGSNYTVAPTATVVGSTGHTGSCTTVTATLGTPAPLGGAAVTGFTATGCSLFSEINPPLTVASQTAATGFTAASGIGVGSNMWQLPDINTATTLTAAACGTGLTQTTAPANAYTFTVAPLSTSPPFVGTIISPITATNPLTISTTSTYPGLYLVYNPTSSGVTVACTGAGASAVNGAVTVNSNTVTLTPAQLPPGSPNTIQAIACGNAATTEGNSAATVIASRTAVAYPQIASIANTKDVTARTPAVTGTPDRVQALTTENFVTATITNPTTTAGSFFCYSTNGTTPNCTCTAAGLTKITAASTMVSITQNNTNLQAIGCALDANGTTIDPSALSSVAYTLQITPPALALDMTLGGACPAADSVKFGAALADGATTNTVTTCYGLSQPVSCAAATGITCVTALPSAMPFSGNSTANLYVLQCATGFPNRATTLSISPLLPYAAPTVVVDGALAEWGTVPSDSLVAGTSPLTGGFTYNAGLTNLFVATGGLTVPTATQGLVVYLSSNLSPVANTTTTSQSGTATLPFAAEYAVVVNISAVCAPAACPVSVFQATGGVWVAGPAGLAPTANIATSATGVEIKLVPAGTDLANATTVNVAGAVFTGSGVGATLSGEWPGSGAWQHFHTTLNSCVTPAASVQ